jgi:hypothetical protein
VEFEFKGIRVAATVEIGQSDYKDADNRLRTRFERAVRVHVRFWDFFLENGNLQEFAFVKSTLNYFMQAYWKRSSKEGGRIELVKALHHENPRDGRQALYFSARQKNKKNFLHICLTQNGATVDEVYLDGQEVIMLDVAIGRAISLLPPRTVEPVASLF